MSIDSTTRGRQSIVSEPNLDVGEARPLVYGYLHKLGRNGHWQHRFFETDGERLTYYKDVKRTNVLATLDLCKVNSRREWSWSYDYIPFFFEFIRNLIPFFLQIVHRRVIHRWEKSP